MNKVSIIVPVYQVEDYIERCIKSLISQTYKNIEIILVDDGSTDKSGEICDKFAKQDNRIIVIHKSNEGVSSTRNKGIDISTGNYITFVDADDYIDKEYVKILIDMCLKEQVDISIIGTKDWVNKRIINQSRKLNKKISKKEGIKELIDNIYFACVIWGKIYKRELFDDIRFNNKTIIAEDMEIIYRLIDKAENGIYVNTEQLLYNYEVRENSALHKKITKDHVKEIVILEDFMKFINDNYPELYNNVIGRYICKNAELILEITYRENNNKEVISILKGNILKYKKNINKLNLERKIRVYIALYSRHSIKFLRKIKRFFKNRY